MKRALLPVLLMFVVGLLAVSPANAVVIYQIDQAGKQTVYEPSLTDWVSAFSDDTVVTKFGSDYEVQIARSLFGTGDGPGQAPGIYGAGVVLSAAIGYRIDFTAQLYTWDSYTDWQRGSLSWGYWDVFAVNMNQEGYYWDVVRADPIVAPDPAGNVVVDGSVLPGITWAWGGFEHEANVYEQFIGNGTITLRGNPNVAYYLSFTLDTLTELDSDNNHPSYGAFNPRSPVPPPLGGDPEPPRPVSEPSTALFLGVGLVGLYLIRRNH